MRSEHTKDMILCAMFVALIAAGAFIKIPVPVVPFTLQYLFTMLAGLLLGGRKGCFAVCVYILLGLVGLPIFAQGGGIGYLISNFYLQNPIGLWPLFLYCFLLAVPGDILLCIIGAIIGRRMIPLIQEGRL